MRLISERSWSKNNVNKLNPKTNEIGCLKTFYGYSTKYFHPINENSSIEIKISQCATMDVIGSQQCHWFVYIRQWLPFYNHLEIKLDLKYMDPSEMDNRVGPSVVVN